MANNKYASAVFNNPNEKSFSEPIRATTDATLPKTTNKYATAVFHPKPYSGVKITLEEPKAPAKAAIVKPTTGPMSPTERYKKELPAPDFTGIRKQNAVQNASSRLFKMDDTLMGQAVSNAKAVTEQARQPRAEEIQRKLAEAQRQRAQDLQAKITELQHQQDIYFDAVREEELKKAKQDYANVEETLQKTSLAADTVGKGAGMFNQGAASFADFMSNVIPRVEGWITKEDPEATFTGQLLKPLTKATGAVKDYVDTTVAKIDENAAEKIGDSKAKQTAYNLGSGTVAALPQAVLAMMTMGGSTATQLPAQSSGLVSTVSNALKKAMSKPTFKLSFAQQLGSDYEEAKAQGATDMEAMVSATISSYVNALIESSGGIDELPEEIRDLDLTTPQKAWRWVVSMLDEGKEGTVQNVVTQMTNKGIFAEDTPLISATDENAVFNPKRMAKDFASEAAVGGILGGGQMLVQSGINAATKTDSRYNEMMRDIDSIMPRLPQEQSAASQTAQEAAVPNAPNTAPTKTNVEQRTVDDAVSEVLPNVAEHRDTAAQILNDGIFDSPTYGDALEQTGMKRSDVRQALRKIAQNTPGAELDSDVQSVIGAIRNADTQADTFTQTTPEQQAAETVSDQMGKTERAPVNENVDADNASTIVDEADETPANPAMGAADYGYSGDIGGWKRDADTFTKDTEIPKYDKNGNTISDSAGTMFNMNVPKETKEMIERFSYEGEFSIQRDTNNAQVDRVHDDIAKSSFNDVYNQTVGAVLNGQASADITARLGVLMVQAANRAEANPGQGYDAQAAILAKLTAQHGHNAASALQAYNIFNKLTPQGRLAGTQKIVEQLNNSVKVRNPVPENEQSDFTKAVRSAVNEALKDLENIGDAPEAPVTGDAAVGAVVAEAAKSAADGDEAPKRKNAKKKAERDHGLEVENWMTEVGNQLAETLSRQPKAPKPKTVSATVKQDLLRFAKDYLPTNKHKAQKRTALDTLTDFLANKEQYVEAWNAAKKAYKESHPDDYDGFAGATITYSGSGSDPVMTQAIVEAAAAEHLTKKNIDIRTVLGDQSGLEKQIADILIEKTGATGSDADMIRMATTRYFNENKLDIALDQIAKGLNSDIQKAVRDSGTTMANIVRQNKNQKGIAAKVISGMLVKKYGISQNAATTAANIIIDRFNTIVEQKSQETLDSILADREKAKPKSAAQKITELGNLGAFESEAHKGKAAETAKQYVDTDIKKAVKAIGKKAAEIIRSSPADKAATAERIKKMLMENHQLSEADAKKMGDFIVDRFNNYVNERAKTALKNYVKPKNKRQQKTLEERFRDMANMGAFSSPYASDVAQKLFGANIHIDPDLVTEYLNATDPKDIRAVEEKIYENIGKQIPSTFADKWNAWRFMGMLGTIKAPFRNNLGNIGGWAMRNAKNLPASIGEAMLQRIGKIDQSQRTKTILPAGKERRDAAKRDFDYVKREIAGVGKHNIANQAIEDNRRIFTPRMIKLLRRLGANLPEKADNISVEGLRKAINVMMSDTLFSKDAYVSSLANYLRAQGFTGADFESGKMTQEQKDAARAYAIQEAQEATYRDFNTFTELVTSVRFNPERAKSRHGKTAMKAGNVVLQGIQPILKTPANVLARSIEYSPFGLATTIVDAAVSKKRGDYKATKVLNDLSKNSVGLLLSALGWFWAANGKLVISSGDEDQDDLEGKEKFSLIHNGEAYSLDWLAPIAPALFMGAAFYDLFDKRSENGAPLFDKIANVFNSLTNPMIEMSVLSGLKDTIENVRYAENGATAIVMNAAIDYLGQGIPTIWGQIEKAASSPVQERTLVDKGDPILNADLQRVLGTISKKTPGWDYNQVPYIDAWGRVTETGGPLERFWDSVVSPFNKSEIIVTPVDEEIRRLEKELDGVNLTPSKADSDITVNGEQVILTNEEYVTYAMEKGQGDLAIRMMELSDPDYQNLNASAKGRAQLCSKDLADNLAKIAAGFELKDMPDWQAELVGASVEEMAQACIKQAIINEASSSQYENRSDGFSHMLSDKSIDDQIALALMPKEASDTYTAFTEVMNVPVQQFLDIYGTATAASNKKDEQWAAAVQRIRGMDISNSEKYTLEFGMYYSFVMGKELREKYNAHVKGSSISNSTYMDAAKYYGAYNPEEHGGVERSEAMYDYVVSVCPNMTAAKTLFLGFFAESTWEKERKK